MWSSNDEDDKRPIVDIRKSLSARKESRQIKKNVILVSVLPMYLHIGT